MSDEVRGVPTPVTVCDLCDEIIAARGDGAGLSGSVTRGYIAHPVSNVTRHAWLMWPPEAWKRRRKPQDVPADIRYDFHGECIVGLVERAIADRKSGGSETQGSNQDQPESREEA